MTAALQLDVFAPLRKTAAKNEEAIAALVPIARELAAAAGSDGITVHDLRVAAQSAGYIKRQNTRDRSRSYLGAVMVAAGLRATDRHRRANHPELAHSHGNLARVWVAPGVNR